MVLHEAALPLRARLCQHHSHTEQPLVPGGWIRSHVMTAQTSRLSIFPWSLVDLQ